MKQLSEIHKFNLTTILSILVVLYYFRIPSAVVDSVISSPANEAVPKPHHPPLHCLKKSTTVNSPPHPSLSTTRPCTLSLINHQDSPHPNHYKKNNPCHLNKKEGWVTLAIEDHLNPTSNNHISHSSGEYHNNTRSKEDHVTKGQSHVTKGQSHVT